MLKRLNMLSILVSLLLFLYIVMRIAGVIIWIDGMVIDKWVAVIGIFNFPFCIYRFLKTQEVASWLIRTVCIAVSLVNVVWYLCAPGPTDNYYIHIKKDKLLPAEYVIKETPNHQTPMYFGDQFETDYTFYRAFNKYVYVVESSRKAIRGQVDKMKWSGYEVGTHLTNKFDKRVYIHNKTGYLFVE
ncbi:hypothetical protein [Bacillus cereus]|uniref:Uncharacterized protein n=1 Tax=Bacillus cereus TaxID=1396 RepID=A0A164NZ83_BACCE|nr:hypothetical protein [Bacillus cereus]KZD66017.1 hypothetical protein B4088_2774 [Bacillus cereus]